MECVVDDVFSSFFLCVGKYMVSFLQCLFSLLRPLSRSCLHWLLSLASVSHFLTSMSSALRSHLFAMLKNRQNCKLAHGEPKIGLVQVLAALVFIVLFDDEVHGTSLPWTPDGGGMVGGLKTCGLTL